MSLSGDEALKFILSWTPESDVTAFRYNNVILSASSAVTAAYINYRYRRGLKLRNFAYISTYCAAVFIPSVASALLHGMLVVEPLLTHKQGAGCAVCLETKSALSQVGCGVLYPMLLSPLAAIPFADRYMTMAVPSFRHQPKLALEFVAKLVKPFYKKVFILAVSQVVIGMAVCHWEISNLYTVVQKVSAMEAAVEQMLPKEELKRIKEESEKELFELDIEPPKPKYPFLLE